MRKRPGVVSSHVGYTGGDVPNSTYRNHGTHAEAIEIIFDPSVTSYRELLKYWDNKHGSAVAGIKMVIGATIGKTLDHSIEGVLAP